MDEIMISVDFMNLGFSAIAIVLVLGFATIFIKNKALEWTLCVFKALVYLGLVWYMWKYVGVKGVDKIGVVSAFTFIVSCFECSSNVTRAIEIVVEAIRV